MKAPRNKPEPEKTPRKTTKPIESAKDIRLNFKFSAQAVKDKLLVLAGEDHRSPTNYLEKLILEAWSARTKNRIAGKIRTLMPEEGME
jgi:hypothetical protein